MSDLLRAALALVLVVAMPVCFANALWRFLRLALVGIGRALGPSQPVSSDPRAYWARQMWLDAGRAARTGLWAIWITLTVVWLRGTVKRLFAGRGSNGLWEPAPFARFLRRCLAPGTAVGAVLGALLAGLLTSAVLAVFGLLLALVWLLAAALALALRTIERVWELLRGIRMKCPHPGCYRPVRPAVHLCPDCGSAHRWLLPGQLGVLWQVCRCGRRLPATRLLGRSRLAAQCPHCDLPLPEAAGTVPVVHVPFVGGTSSGKTMLMAATVAGLESWAQRSALTVDFASPTDRRHAGTLDQQLSQTGWAHATTGGQPRAFMLTVRYRRRRRLLYLYDPMGESLREAEVVREQQYLAHADGVVLVVDVLADPGVRRSLGGADAERADSARPAAQGPVETYARLTGELAALTGRRTRLPVAVVVTKRDVLDRLGALPVPGARVDDWLGTERIGLGGLVRGLRHDFGGDRYWAVSARAATGAGALESEQRRAAEAVLWLLARSGLRTGSLVAGPSPVSVPRPRGSATRDRTTSQ